MSEIYLTDIVIRYSSDGPSDLPGDANIFVFVDDGRETKRTECFVKDPTGRSWRLGVNIEVAETAQLTGLIVMMEYPSDEFQQLGLVELARTDLLAQRAEENHEIVRALIQSSDGPPLELVSHCVVIPLDIPPERSSDMFKDAAEEEDFERRWNLAQSFGQIMTPDNVKRISADVIYEHALRLSDENTEKPSRLMRAGDIFLEAHEESRKNVDLDKAIAVYEVAIRLTPDGHQCQASLHGQLGMALTLRIGYSGNTMDIDNAIFAFECSLLLTPDGHSAKPNYLNNLGNCFSDRFEYSGDLIDIDKAIAAHEQAAYLTPYCRPAKPAFFFNLGNSFTRRFEHSRDLVDVDKAIAAQEQAVHLTGLETV